MWDCLLRALITRSNRSSLSDWIHFASNLILSGASLARGYALWRLICQPARRLDFSLSFFACSSGSIPRLSLVWHSLISLSMPFRILYTAEACRLVSYDSTTMGVSGILTYLYMADFSSSCNKGMCWPTPGVYYIPCIYTYLVYWWWLCWYLLFLVVNTVIGVALRSKEMLPPNGLKPHYYVYQK